MPIYSPPSTPREGRLFIRFTEHFIGNSALGSMNDQSGNGGGFNIDQGHNELPHLGVCKVQTQGNSLGIGGIGTVRNALGLGVGSGYLDWVFRIETLSDGTDTYTALIGFFGEDDGSAVPKDGVYLRYTDGVNAGRWQLVAHSNSSETVVDTGVAADTAWHRIRLSFPDDGSSVVVAFDGGGQVAEVDSNIPIGPFRVFGAAASIRKSAGTNNRAIYVDMVDMLMTANL